MTLTSPAFEHDQPIPSKYTCDGDDINPPLSVADVPDNAASLTLKVVDPDSPSGHFLHWIVVGMPPTTTRIKEGIEPPGRLGRNDFGRDGWGGPCPLQGRHRYIFTLTAYDDGGGEIATAQLIGTYERTGDDRLTTQNVVKSRL